MKRILWLLRLLLLDMEDNLYSHYDVGAASIYIYIK